MSDDEFMSMALQEAKKALESGDVPVGAVLVKDGKIIARGFNQREKERDTTSHAEMEAIRKGGKALQNWRLEGTTLYVTLEPCLMCASAIYQARISRLVYGASDPKEGAISSHVYFFDDPKLANRPLLSKGVLADECQRLLSEFFALKRKEN